MNDTSPKRPKLGVPQRPHISFPTRDIQASRRFYEALLSMPATKVEKGYVKFSSELPALNFSLTETTAEVVRTGATHYGIEVESAEAVTAFRERLVAAGVSVSAEAEGTCCYSVQSKFWVQDPDGNPWEIFHVSRDANEFGQHGQSTGLGVPAPPEAPCCAADCCT